MSKRSLLPYMPALDGIRGLSILLVVIFHFGFIDMGYMGVEVFFVLSGYLITGILAKGKKWPLGFFLKRFYWRRALRIFPLYFGFLVLMLIAYLLVSHPSGTLDLMPYLATYSFNVAMLFIDWTDYMVYHHLWSLSFEEQFYLIWPLLVFVLPRKGLLALCWALVLLSPVIRHLLADYQIAMRGTTERVGGIIYYLPIGQLDAFATGGLLVLLRPERWIRNPMRVFWIMLGVFLAVGAVNLGFHLEEDPEFAWTNLGYPIASIVRGQHIWSYTLVNLTAAALILVAVHPQAQKGGRLRRMLEGKPLVELGKISYGVYILHWPIQMLLEKFIVLQSNVLLRFLQFLPYFAFVLLICWLSFRYYESWFLRQKKSKFHPPPPVSS